MNGRPAIGIALLGFALVCPVASADGLRLGVQAGLERWNVDLDVQLVDQSGTIEADFAPGVGVLGQYIFRAPAEDERPFFVGFELGYAAQNISEAGTFDVSGVPVETTADISWSVDALWLAGYDFGRVSAFVAGGGSYLASELTAAGAGLSGRDQNTHIGFKVAPGVEIKLNDSSALLVRVDYARYQDKKYTGSGSNLGLDLDIDINVQPRLFDVRVAWVYEFRNLSLPRLFGR